MRTLIVIAAALLVSQYGIAQDGGRGGGGGRGGRGGGRGGPVEPPPPPNPGFECFQSVETPEFPQAALQAHIDATAWVTLQVTPQGTADKIETKITSAWENGPKIFTPAVEKVIRAAKFKPECTGKTVGVVYRYDLEGEAVAAPKAMEKTEARVMYIESQPELKAAGNKTK
jgi:Gram-negative bacterial TonB protein C-terminal